MLPINLLPSGEPNVSCEPELGEPIVPGVELEPGGVIPGRPDPVGHKCAPGAQANAPYGCGGYKP